MAEEMTKTEIRFKLFDTIEKKVITDSSWFNSEVSRDNGIGTITISRPNCLVLRGTFFFAEEGGEIFQDDIVKATCDGEETTDKVWWNGEGWQLGGYVTPMHEIKFHKIEGNANEIPWPTDLDEANGSGSAPVEAGEDHTGHDHD